MLPGVSKTISKVIAMPNLSAFTGVLGQKRAAHLLRRATFAPTKTLINEYAAKTPAQALAQLLQVVPIGSKPIEPVTETSWVDIVPTPSNIEETNLKGYIIAWMLDNFRTDTTLRSKMILFLHQNWMVDDVNGGNHIVYDYLKLLEFYSLGSYKSLALKMCRDNKMLIYLDGYQNKSYSPNENYAREFFELFTIGKGPQIAPGNYTNFTEDDIKQAAKLLSGYLFQLDNTKTDPDTGIRYCRTNYWSHSSEDKQFSECFQNTVIAGTFSDEGMAQELSEFVNMIFRQDETAKNICRKLYRYFVHRDITPAVESDIIIPLASSLKNNNYNLGVVLNQLLQSNHFYDLDQGTTGQKIVGGIVKSPLELIFQMMNFFSISPFDLSNASAFSVWDTFYRLSIRNHLLANSGMSLFSTSTVAGYAAYYSAPNWDRNWFDSSSITQRYYLGRCFLENKRLPYRTNDLGAQFDMVVWVRNNISDPSAGSVIVDELLNYLFPEPPSAERKTYFLNEVLFGTLSQNSWAFAWADYINNGALEVVKPRLELLFKAIIYSQEYQLQ